MRLIDLEDILLVRVEKIVKNDGDPGEIYHDPMPYQSTIQYLDDSVSATIYGADITKTYRISSIRNELESLLLPKVNNTNDNISMYLIQYKEHLFKIARVTPKYIDISWR